MEEHNRRSLSGLRNVHPNSIYANCVARQSRCHWLFSRYLERLSHGSLGRQGFAPTNTTPESGKRGDWGSICTPIRDSLRAMIGRPGAGGASREFGSRFDQRRAGAQPGSRRFKFAPFSARIDRIARACGFICVTRGTGENYFPAARAQHATESLCWQVRRFHPCPDARAP